MTMWSVWSAFILLTYANLLLSKFADVRDKRSLAVSKDDQKSQSISLEVQVFNGDGEEEALVSPIKNRKQSETRKNVESLKRSTRDLTSNDQNMRTVSPRFTGCTRVDNSCQNGGTCLINHRMSGGSSQCLCNFGYAGPACEQPVDIRFPKFDTAQSYVKMKLAVSTTPNLTVIIELTTYSTQGLILYSNPGPPDAFFSLTLINSKLEFRFGLNKEIMSMTTKEQLNRHKWYKIKVERIGRKGAIYIDNILASPDQVSFSKTLVPELARDYLYIGGFPKKFALNMQDSIVAQAGNGAEVHFLGCVKFLSINGKVKNLRRGSYVGDILQGAGITDCTDLKLCPNNQCGKGRCKMSGPTTFYCLCPKNASGPKCEKSLNLKMPRFTGKSYLKYTVLKRTSRSQTNLEVVFKPFSKTGLLLYSGYSRDRRGDFLAIFLRKGIVEAYFDLGSGVAHIKSKRAIAMKKWHRVFFKRIGRLGYLTVDNQEMMEAVSPGDNVQLTLRQDFFLGNHENYDHVSYFMPMKKGFKGCVQKLAVNGKLIRLINDSKESVNVENCNHPCSERINQCSQHGECMPIMDYFNCSCKLSYMGDACEQKMNTDDITYPKFSGQSYLLFNNSEIMKKLSMPKMTLTMTVNLKQEKNKGVLLFLGANMESYSRYILLKVYNNKIAVFINDGLAEPVKMKNFGNILGNREYIITLKRVPGVTFKRDHYTILLDKSGITTVNQPRDPKLPPYPQLLIGGVDKHTAARLNLAGNSGITGCIKKIQLETSDGEDVLRVSDADGGRSIAQCQQTRT